MNILFLFYNRYGYFSLVVSSFCAGISASTSSSQQRLAVERRNSKHKHQRNPQPSIVSNTRYHADRRHERYLLHNEFLVRRDRRESDNWNDTLSLEYDVVLTVVIDMLEIQVAQPFMIVIGIIGNLITMMYILVNKKLQKPFYYCIVNLALGDIISLLSNPYCRKISLEFFPGLCTVLNFMFIFESVRQYSNLFSGLGVLILGYVRYLLFARPFQGIKYLTKARVLFSFCVSSVLSGVYGYFTAKVLYSSRGFQ